MDGGDASDFIFDGPGNDSLKGSGGGDFFFGDAGDDTLDGGVGDDLASFFDSAGVQANLATSVATGQGTDSLTGIEELGGSNWAADTLIGDEGPNTFYPGGGDDTVDGAGDLDLVSYHANCPDCATGITVDLGTGVATGSGTDTLQNIEQVEGTDMDDSLMGDLGPNVLDGFAGDDVISGAAGDDTLDGGEGYDTLDGGDGSDTCWFGEVTAGCEHLIVSRAT